MMTVDEIVKKLTEKGYLAFENHANGPIKIPFVMVLNEGTDNIFMDNCVYYKVNNISLELYTRQNHEEEYSKFEKCLDEIGLCWNCEYHTWIDEEKLMDSRYLI